MIDTKNIPYEHRYRRVLLAINNVWRKRMLLLALFNFVFAFTWIWFAAFKPNNAFQRYHIFDFLKSLPTFIFVYRYEILIVVIVSSLIGLIIAKLSWVVKTENKIMLEEYLAQFSSFLADFNLLPLIMDPVLLPQYEPRRNSLAKRISTFVKFEKSKNAYNISFITTMAFIPYIIGLIGQLVSIHNMKEPKVYINRTRISIINGAVMIFLLLAVPVIAVSSLTLQIEANVVVAIIAIDLIAAILYFIYFFGLRFDHNQAKGAAIAAIILIMFFRDSEHDFPMFEFKRYHPELTYEHIVRIVESLVYN